METIAYFAGLELLMKQTSNASVKRCSRMWKHILKERALKLYEALQSKYNWLRQMEIM